ncbi:MAG: HD domain-containing protein [Cyclobacteriaceae bacterium]|nr:HD domain-containing protein [Flammeovirgaceae bacterium]
MEKKKIINDPVYGFITFRSDLVFDLLEHPFFQRLRHIRQIGLSEMVYPGATHSRFHHALGAMHLMGKVLDNLRTKGVGISQQEFEAAQAAILLHDIGHGPFSHALEETLLPGLHHESLSYLFMQDLNRAMAGRLELAMKIFRNSYSRKFFHQLVSSQLDIDRLDYLQRDSFYSGVVEGTIGVDRIIAMLDVQDDQLVVEENGIYSIENFLHARRLMYWQLYLHKTAVSAERMLVNLIRRAQYLCQSEQHLPASAALTTFLSRTYTLDEFKSQRELLKQFGQLDDRDIWGGLKAWQDHRDPILSELSTALLHRQLFQIKLSQAPISKSMVEKVKRAVGKSRQLLQREARYLFSHGTVTNEAYVAERQGIAIKMKDGRLLDIAQASDLPSIKAISKIVKKNYLCWPKNVSL